MDRVSKREGINNGFFSRLLELVFWIPAVAGMTDVAASRTSCAGIAASVARQAYGLRSTAPESGRVDFGPPPAASPNLSRLPPASICPPVVAPSREPFPRPSSSGLGRRPFTAKTGVRVPLGAPMIGEQTPEGRRENPAQANKLSRTFARLLEALNRHRGKGQQKVTVEHVHVHSGAQAVVGTVETPGGGDRLRLWDQPLQSRLPMHRSAQCGARTWRGRPCRSPAMPNGRCRMHGGLSPGAPKGNRNAFKHGRYIVETIARRRELAALVRAMRALVGAAEAEAARLRDQLKAILAEALLR